MACGDAQHRHTCNSLSNCYWSGNDGNFYSGIIPEGWTGENVDATNDGGLTFQSMEVPGP